MTLALEPPVAPMLAKLSRELPVGDFVYEPKWDGFRCLAFREGETVDLRSRHQKQLARYFPEVVADLLAVKASSFIVDGELVVMDRDGFDFSALLQRLHPAASRVDLLRDATPASFIVFDLLALDDDLTSAPFRERRSRLEPLLDGPFRHLRMTPATTDPEEARRWLELARGGIDGVIAKDPSLPYAPGKRAMVKTKLERTADCVVGAFRWHQDEPTVGSLLLGLYDDEGSLRHVGLAASFSAARRRDLTEAVRPYIADLGGHPWEHGFNIGGGPVGRLPGAASRWAYGGDITFVPLAPELVCEVSYDHLEGERFRHPLRFKRWRPDRDPASCTYDQFERSDAGLVQKLLT